MPVRKRIIFTILILIALFMIGLLPRHLAAPHVVARAETPDGFELCIVQRWSFNELPWFTTSFLCRQPDGAWTRYYFNHEDRYWSGGRVALDTSNRMATFYRGDSKAVVFAWTTGSYTNLYRRHIAQPELMPPGWSPWR